VYNAPNQFVGRWEVYSPQNPQLHLGGGVWVRKETRKEGKQKEEEKMHCLAISLRLTLA